jgi:murein DD-endopeptidase MepM/ murein hydrolase activator NlpD
MITKEKTSRALVAAYLLVIPAVALLLAGFATRPPSGGPSQGRSGLMLQDHVPSITPVDRGKTTVSSGFGNRIDPITNKEKFHTGIDLRLSEGNLVFVTADGIVFESKTDSVHGNYIIVKHSDVYMTSYSHLKSRIVEAGEALTQGQAIGYVGSTGLSTAPHLHYEVLKDGKPVDPKDYFQKLE